MPSGLQVWGADRVPTLDTTDRQGIVLGVLSGIEASGVISVPGFGLGEPFYLTQMNVKWQDSKGFILPNVTISGNTLSWSNAGNFKEWRIMWGVR